MRNDNVHELVEILARLRAPGGCPWDREQTHDSLKRFLVEETGELLDAIENCNDASMIDELGDVLLQIVFHAQIASEQGRFDLQDVVRSECAKMIRRHPHVFGNKQVVDADGVVDQWEELKQQEKSDASTDKSAIAGVPRNLPGLHRAQKIQRKAARIGFEWSHTQEFIAKIQEELAELIEAVEGGRQEEIAEETGDLLFAVVNLARQQELEAEELMHAAVAKFDRRFRKLEKLLAKDGNTVPGCSLELLVKHWAKTKCKAR